MLRWMAAAFAASTLALTAAMPAWAQTPNRVYRLGHFSPTVASEKVSRDFMVPELARLGFVEGRNLVVDWRIGDAGLVRELAAGRPDAIFIVGNAVVIANEAKTTVPIVSIGPDLIELGLAASYARPGGSMTGVAILGAELDVKRLDLMRDALPARRRVAALLSSTVQASRTTERDMRVAATSAAIELHAFYVATAADYPAAFAAMRAAGAEALVITATPLFNADMKVLAALALEARLPTICEWARNARDGCLMGYGPEPAALRRRNAAQLALVFRGTAPGDIPIEQPSVFEFAVNLQTAKALAIDLPSALVNRADEVIE